MAAPTDENPMLRVQGLSRRFPGVLALDGVDMTLHRGEVLAVIGENGAGKSTLMKILAGVQTADRGEILLDGRPAGINTVQDALQRGIALIHQELNLADNLDVAANIFLGREPRRLGLIHRRRLHQQAQAIMDRLGLDCSPRTPLGRLSIGRQQMVEIAKALSINARVLIMDEPTSSLSQREAEELFKVVGELRDQGVSIIYISHRLGEVKRIADRVTVLRDGRNAGELGADDIDHDGMVRLMVGRDVSQFYDHQPHEPGQAALQVQDLRTPAHSRHPLSFELRRGEIVGLAGLVGAGRSELLQTLFGVTPAVGGAIRVRGEDVDTPRHALDAMNAGLALVPEDRKAQGLIIDMAVRPNLSLARLRRDGRAGFLDPHAERRLSQEMTRRLDIRCPSDQQIVRYLSGGNQQKVVLGKWLAIEPDVLLLDEPTRGIDVGAKEEIYRLMEQLAERGVAILFASSELEEILGMADRALVMHEGRLTGQLQRHQLSEEAVMHLATGGEPADAPATTA